MIIVYEKKVIDQIREAYQESLVSGRKIEKVLVTREEWDKLREELKGRVGVATGALNFNRRHEVFGIRVVLDAGEF